MNLDKFFLQLQKTSLKPWSSYFLSKTFDHFSGNHKDSLAKWKILIDAMPVVEPGKIDFAASVVSALPTKEVTNDVKEKIEKGLRELNPWRKGPFHICGVTIDSEWRSDMKWDRIKDQIAPLKERLVLDVGAGNGYHCYRALGAGANFVLGIDHKLTFFAQNQALLKYLQTDQTAVLPLGIDDMPQGCDVFDTIFSMGVLYHVHSPKDHLMKIKSLLRPAGEVVLETLVIDGKVGDILNPEDRYARMPNVRNIPSCATALNWLEECGFQNARVMDVTQTTTQEQHTNDWGVWQSLEHFLDEKDPSKTVEGYPAPTRAIFLANK